MCRLNRLRINERGEHENHVAFYLLNKGLCAEVAISVENPSSTSAAAPSGDAPTQSSTKAALAWRLDHELRRIGASLSPLRSANRRLAAALQFLHTREARHRV